MCRCYLLLMSENAMAAWLASSSCLQAVQQHASSHKPILLRRRCTGCAHTVLVKQFPTWMSAFASSDVFVAVAVKTSERTCNLHWSDCTVTLRLVDFVVAAHVTENAVKQTVTNTLLRNFWQRKIHCVCRTLRSRQFFPAHKRFLT